MIAMASVWIVHRQTVYGEETDVAAVFANEADAKDYLARASARRDPDRAKRGIEWYDLDEVEVQEAPLADAFSGPLSPTGTESP